MEKLRGPWIELLQKVGRNNFYRTGIWSKLREKKKFSLKGKMRNREQSCHKTHSVSFL